MNAGRSLVALRWKKTTKKQRSEEARQRALAVPEDERRKRMSELVRKRWAKKR